jgi:hypothetical protein
MLLTGSALVTLSNWIQERYYRFQLPDQERLLVFESRSDAEDGEVLEYTCCTYLLKYLPGAC